MKYSYVTKLSDRIVRDNIGQLICVDVPIARSGSQDYLEDEVSGNGSSKIVKLQRPWDVVKESAPTFEGKPFLNGHSDEDITIENVNQKRVGHVQNVRTDDAQELLIADLIVSDPATIELIETKKMRDVSCGYFYELDGNVVKKIIGEHVALVPTGRAGNARILDAVKKPVDKFLIEKEIKELKIGDTVYLPMNRTEERDFVKIVNIVKNGNEYLVLTENNKSYDSFVFDEDDKVKGLFGDIKEPKLADAEPDTIKLYRYAIYNDKDEIISYVAIDREGEEGTVINKSFAAVFTTTDWKSSLSPDYEKNVKKALKNYSYIEVVEDDSWLD